MTPHERWLANTPEANRRPPIKNPLLKQMIEYVPLQKQFFAQFWMEWFGDTDSNFKVLHAICIVNGEEVPAWELARIRPVKMMDFPTEKQDSMYFRKNDYQRIYEDKND